jgi:hypothetical protein
MQQYIPLTRPRLNPGSGLDLEPPASTAITIALIGREQRSTGTEGSDLLGTASVTYEGQQPENQKAIFMSS